MFSVAHFGIEMKIHLVTFVILIRIMVRETSNIEIEE